MERGSVFFGTKIMPELTFRGVRYQTEASRRDDKTITSQLVYRHPINSSESSNKSARVEAASSHDRDIKNKLVYRGIPIRKFEDQLSNSSTIREGGIIRSRMTAELLSVEHVKQKSRRVYRGVSYEDVI